MLKACASRAKRPQLATADRSMGKFYRLRLHGGGLSRRKALLTVPDAPDATGSQPCTQVLKCLALISHAFITPGLHIPCRDIPCLYIPCPDCDRPVFDGARWGRAGLELHYARPLRSAYDVGLTIMRERVEMDRGRRHGHDAIASAAAVVALAAR